MRDIAYFRTTIPHEPGEGPVGWAIAEVLGGALRGAGIEVGETKAWWDGVKFGCRVGRSRFEVEVTPYFEADPVEWSVQFRRVGWMKYFLGRATETKLHDLLDAAIGSDARFGLTKWESLRELRRRQARRRE